MKYVPVKVCYQFLLFCCQKHLSVVCFNSIAGAANNVKSRKNIIKIDLKSKINKKRSKD
jgi:hypothetical protein